MDGRGGGVIAMDGWDLPADIAVPDRYTGRVRVECRGTSPYIGNALSEDRILAIVADMVPRMPPEFATMANMALRGIVERRWWREHVAPQCVERRDGRPGIPSRHLLRCLIEAGVFEIDHRRGRLTDRMSTRTQVPGLIRIEEDFLPFPNDEWVLDVRDGERQRRKVKIPRAKFPSWGFTATIAFDPVRLPPERFRHLCWVAGYRVGLGSFRKDPRRDRIRAVFGRFKIERWEVLAGDQAAEAA